MKFEAWLVWQTVAVYDTKIRQEAIATFHAEILQQIVTRTGGSYNTAVM